MTAVALALSAALAACAVLFVARGFLRRPGEREDDVLEPVDQARLAALDARDRALAALQELEFDHRTGKVSDDDYARLLGPLRQEAARALLAVDAHAAADGGPGEAAREDVPEPVASPDGTGLADEAGGEDAPVAEPDDAVAGPAPREP
ncbi:MAG: hypothetical protein R3C15_05075 [Thermoleophilia bacterium]